MADLNPMYRGVAGDRTTELMYSFNPSTDTKMTVFDTSIFPNAPNYITVRMANKSCLATFKYTGISGNEVTGLTFQESDIPLGETAVYPVNSAVYWSLSNKLLTDIEENIETIGAASGVQHASKTVYGTVKIGDGIDVTDGVISTTGGGGTGNYNDLTNKPQINSVELTGDKSPSDLGLATIDNLNSEASIRSAADTALQTAVSGKQDTLVSGTNIKTINGNSVLGSGDITISTTTAFADITGQPSDNTNLNTALNSKVNIAQGTDKAGKLLKVGTDGNVTTGDMPTSAVWGNITGTLADQSDLNTALGTKVDKETGKGLSTNDYTTAEKTKLSGIEEGAEVNVLEGVKDATGTLLPISSKTVTLSKTAVGLGNVDNTSDANKPVSTAMQTALDAKVTAVAGKGLSTNDFTDTDKTAITNIETQLSSNPNGKLSDENFSTALKTKLDAIPSDAQANVIETVKVNGTALTPVSKAVDVTVPTKVSDLTNDSAFQTATEVSTSISTHNTATDAHSSLFAAKLSIEGPTGSPYTAGQIAKVDSDGILKVMAAGTTPVAWNDVTSKPFTSVGAGLTVDSDALKVSTGSASGTICAGDDSRLSDARSPTAHANTHTNGTDDIQTASASQKGLLSKEDWSTFNGKQDALTFDTVLNVTSDNPVTNKAITGAMNDKVDKVTGKQLSTEDFTSALKTKLEGVAAGAQVNVLESVKVNGTAQTITSKAVDITVPTKVSDLTNDSGYQVASDVSTAVSTHNSATDAHQSLFDAKLGTVYSAAEDGYIAKVDSSDHKLKVMPATTATVAFADITGNATDNASLSTALSAKLGTAYSAAEDGYIAKVDSSDHKLKVMAAGTTSVAFADITGSPADNTNLSTALAAKVDVETGKGLSANDFTDTLKTKLDGIAEGAEVNVNADWNATSGDAQILNKPSTFTPSDHASTHNIGGADAIATASSTSNGLLSSADWSTFNGKQDALTIDSALSATSANPVQNKVIKAALDAKVTAVSGKGLSTNDYTTAEQTKLSGIEASAEVNRIASIKDASGTALTITDKAVTLSKAAVGLGNVDNTSDADKPISTATQTALDAKLGITYSSTEDGYIAKVDSSDHKLKVMPAGTTTVAFADITGSPADNTSLNTALTAKVDKVTGSSLVADTEITKLAGIAAGAQVNVIETVKVNGTALTPTDKAVNVTVPTALSSLSDDATHRLVTDTEKTAWNAKQSAITSSAMLSSDLVDDTDKVHLFVSAAEKTTWNAKQNALTFDTEPTEDSTNPVTSGGVFTALEGKVDVISGKGLSTNDYTTAEKTKLSGIETGAQVNVIETVKDSSGAALTITSKAVQLTRAAVGLSNVDNTADANKPISSATQAALDLKVSSTDFTSHTSNTSNPHSVTKAQVGLPNVVDGAQVNVIETVKLNGTALTVTDKAVNVVTPSTLASFTDDSTHRLVTDAEKTVWNAKQNALTFDSAPTSGSANPVTSAGVYTALADKEPVISTKGTAFNKSFGTAEGTVCEGNDSRLSDARTPTAHASTHAKDGSDEISIDAAQITSGTIDASRLPASSFQKLIVVANESERKALTTSDVSKGDTVKQDDTGVMYFCVDTTKLSSDDGWMVYTAVTSWSSITGKPDMPTSASGTLTAAGWSSKSQTVSITGMTATCAAIVTPAPASIEHYAECGVYATSQAAGTLTFSCEDVPTDDLTVNVVMIFT